MGLEEPNITIQFKNNPSQSSAEIMQLSFEWSPTAARERDSNRATSGETRQNQKTAGFPTPKGHGRVKQERDPKHRKTANAHPHRKAKNRGNTLRVKEKSSRPAKTTPAPRKMITMHGHRTIHETEWTERTPNYLSMRRGPQTDYTRTDTSGRGRSYDRNPFVSPKVFNLGYKLRVGQTWIESMKPIGKRRNHSNDILKPIVWEPRINVLIFAAPRQVSSNFICII